MTFRSERNLQIQFVMALISAGAGFYFQLARWEWTALVFAIGLVIGFELLNTAIEVLVDWISPDYHLLAGKVKDVAAGAVFFVSLISIVVGLIIFVPHLRDLLNQ